MRGRAAAFWLMRVSASSVVCARCSPNQPAVTVCTEEWCKILSTHTHRVALWSVFVCVTIIFQIDNSFPNCRLWISSRDEITPVLARMTNS